MQGGPGGMQGGPGGQGGGGGEGGPTRGGRVGRGEGDTPPAGRRESGGRRPGGGNEHEAGVGAGAKAEVNLLQLMGSLAAIMGSTLRARSLEEKATVARRMERHVLPLLASGAVAVPVHATFAMADATDAYAAFAAGGKLGKIVLTR